MRKAFIYLLPLFIFAFAVSCSSNLKSEGENLDKVVEAKEASVGKTYSYTLSQINIERDDTGAYVRLFDTGSHTIFIYVPKNLKNKILNLQKNSKYIYKFKITKNDKFSTLSGQLIEVAGLDGKPVSNSLQSKTPTASSLILDGPDAYGKSFTLELIFKGKGDKNIRMQSPGPYGKDITINYPDSMAKKVDELKDSEKYSVTFKLDKTDWRIFATATEIK